MPGGAGDFLVNVIIPERLGGGERGEAGAHVVWGCAHSISRHRFGCRGNCEMRPELRLFRIELSYSMAF